MAEVKWIKIVTDIFNNKKIKQIDAMPDADAILVIWFKILCLAGTINENGMLILTRDLAYTEEMLATEFRKPINTVRLALRTFEAFRMVEIVNNIYCISNWEKYQNSVGLEKIREQTRKRVEKHRQKQTQLPCNVTVTRSNATELELDREVDIERESSTGDSKESSLPKRSIFAIPGIDEIAEYCRLRKNYVDPDRFLDYYTSNGWMVGKNKMEDWKAAIRSWERSEKKDNNQRDTRNDIDKDYSDFEKM